MFENKASDDLNAEELTPEQRFQAKFNQINPKPPLLKNIAWAFIAGGFVCVLGQFFLNYFLSFGLDKKMASGAVSITLIFLSALLTGLGWYDDLAKRAGAGLAVPITGFANSIVSPAMEFKREGYVFGVGAKMFVIAGPVLVYGTITAVLAGVIYWLRTA